MTISELDTLGDVVLHFRDGDADLLHAVTLAYRDAAVGGRFLVAHGLKVHSDAVGRADLVLLLNQALLPGTFPLHPRSHFL